MDWRRRGVARQTAACPLSDAESTAHARSGFRLAPTCALPGGSGSLAPAARTLALARGGSAAHGSDPRDLIDPL